MVLILAIARQFLGLCLLKLKALIEVPQFGLIYFESSSPSFLRMPDGECGNIGGFVVFLHRTTRLQFKVHNFESFLLQLVSLHEFGRVGSQDNGVVAQVMFHIAVESIAYQQFFSLFCFGI